MDEAEINRGRGPNLFKRAADRLGLFGRPSPLEQKIQALTIEKNRAASKAISEIRGRTGSSLTYGKLISDYDRGIGRETVLKKYERALSEREKIEWGELSDKMDEVFGGGRAEVYLQWKKAEERRQAFTTDQAMAKLKETGRCDFEEKLGRYRELADKKEGRDEVEFALLEWELQRTFGKEGLKTVNLTSKVKRMGDLGSVNKRIREHKEAEARRRVGAEKETAERVIGEINQTGTSPIWGKPLEEHRLLSANEKRSPEEEIRLTQLENHFKIVFGGQSSEVIKEYASKDSVERRQRQETQQILSAEAVMDEIEEKGPSTSWGRVIEKYLSLNLRIADLSPQEEREHRQASQALEVAFGSQQTEVIDLWKKAKAGGILTSVTPGGEVEKHPPKVISTKEQDKVATAAIGEIERTGDSRELRNLFQILSEMEEKKLRLAVTKGLVKLSGKGLSLEEEVALLRQRVLTEEEEQKLKGLKLSEEEEQKLEGTRNILKSLLGERYAEVYSLWVKNANRRPKPPV